MRQLTVQRVGVDLPCWSGRDVPPLPGRRMRATGSITLRARRSRHRDRRGPASDHPPIEDPPGGRRRPGDTAQSKHCCGAGRSFCSASRLLARLFLGDDGQATRRDRSRRRLLWRWNAIHPAAGKRSLMQLVEQSSEAGGDGPDGLGVTFMARAPSRSPTLIHADHLQAGPPAGAGRSPNR